ncbi:MAG: hypothetical protein V1897_05210 [Pseudomonadota bacterium]
MKKLSYLLISLVSVLALMASTAGAQDRGRGHGGGGGAQFNRGGGGGTNRVAPSVNRSAPTRSAPTSINRSAPTRSAPSVNRSSTTRSAPTGINRSSTTRSAPTGINRSSTTRSTPTGQFQKQRTGDRSGPTFSGQKPTQRQLQEHLNLPKTNVGKTRPGLGTIGAATVGAAAGAIALDRFASGRKPVDAVTAGHLPIKGDQARQRLNPQTTQKLRTDFSQRHNDVFNKNWRDNHPNLNNHVWHNRVWPNRPWGYWWGPATWIALSSWIPWNWGTPLYYNFGSNFYYADDDVYLNGRRIASAPEFYNQATQIIDKAPEITDDKDQWLPLGVFAVTQEANKPSNMVLQLAVNKEGVIQGTYFNSDDNTAKPIKGMVDKESQRAVWTFADKNENAVIMETGISNLTEDQTGVLVHFGKERTQEWLMVRLHEPSDKEK